MNSTMAFQEVCDDQLNQGVFTRGWWFDHHRQALSAKWPLTAGKFVQLRVKHMTDAAWAVILFRPFLGPLVAWSHFSQLNIPGNLLMSPEILGSGINTARPFIWPTGVRTGGLDVDFRSGRPNADNNLLTKEKQAVKSKRRQLRYSPSPEPR
jgi:hypothetical protein